MSLLQLDNPKFYWKLLQRWWWLFLIATSLALGYSLYRAYQNPLRYQAQSTVLVAQTSNNPNTTDYANLITSQRLALTYAELLITSPVLQGVIDETGINLTPGQLAGLISVKSGEESQLLRIVVIDTDPVRASVVANVLPTVFSEQNAAFQQNRYAQSKQTLSEEIIAASNQILQTQAAISALGEATNAIQQAELLRLNSLLEQYKQSYASVLRNYESVRLREAQDTANASLIIYEPASTPASQLPRNVQSAVAPFIFGALALAIALAIGIEYVDDRVRSTEMLTSTFSVPVLGTLQLHKEYGDNRPILAKKPFSTVAEAYRNLRTRILFYAVDRPLRVLQITSAQPGEGKSTVAINLAVAFAQAEKKTLLIDADLRLPTISKKLGLDNKFGLTDILLHPEQNFNNYLQASNIPYLSIISSGPIPPNPSEMLGSERMVQLLQKLQETFDYIIIDSPPVLVVTDPCVLAARVDGTLVVARHKKSRMRPILAALESLGELNAHILGLVLNGADLSSMPNSYGKYRKYYGNKSKELQADTAIARTEAKESA